MVSNCTQHGCWFIGMAFGNRVLIIAILIGVFQAVPKASLCQESFFKILDGEKIEFIYQVALLDLKGYFLVDKSYFKIDFKKPESSAFQLYF